MPTRSPLHPRRVTRRLLLCGGAGAAVVGVTGCDSLDPTSTDPTFAPTSTPSTGGTPSDATGTSDPAADDSGLVARAASAIALAHRTIRVNTRLHRDVAPLLRPFERLHLTHGRELGGLPDAVGRVAAASESREQVLARIDRSEARLQQVLIGAAGAARSGALAQTFASMAAAVAQQRTSL